MVRIAIPLGVLGVLCGVCPAGIARGKLAAIDAAVDAASKKGGCAGAVVLVVRGAGSIRLGRRVETLSGQPVDEFAKKPGSEPLKMADTRFRPGWDVVARVAPTGKRDKAVVRAAVHDPRAHLMGGVAGHAGLFGT